MALDLVLPCFLLSTTIIEASRKTVQTSSWLPTWKQDCSSDLVSSFRVPNVAACQVYMDSCPECCIAGYEAATGKCHLLKASPLEVIRTSIPPYSCFSSCGAYTPVKLRTQVVCPLLPHPAKGFVLYPKSRLVHHQAIFSCYVSYYLIGNDTLTCQANGSWSEQPPPCKEMCPILPNPWKGNVSYSSGRRYLDHVTFECNTGYNLTGPRNLTCLANSSWSADPPLCTDLVTSSMGIGPGNITASVVMAGDWIVVQDRGRNVTNFYQAHHNYAYGFGNFLEDFWWGLDNLHLLTSMGNCKLHVELEMFHTGSIFFQEYATFRVSSAATGYKIYVNGSSGTAGDGLEALSGRKFSTYDRDNDGVGRNCANGLRGGWWFTNCFSLSAQPPGSNLNGVIQYCRGSAWYGRQCMLWIPLEPNRQAYVEGLRRSRMMVKLA